MELNFKNSVSSSATPLSSSVHFPMSNRSTTVSDTSRLSTTAALPIQTLCQIPPTIKVIEEPH